MECAICGKKLKLEQDRNVVQVRVGYLEEGDDFFPDEDLEYFCTGCWFDLELIRKKPRGILERIKRWIKDLFPLVVR